MADNNEKNDGFFQWAGGVVASVYRAVTRDGTIDAFLRQGTGELGQALKAFPDSIQVDEPGAVFNPLQSDIAADKRGNVYGSEAPSIEKGFLQTELDRRAKANQDGNADSGQNEQAKGRSLPDDQQDQDHGRGRGR